MGDIALPDIDSENNYNKIDENDDDEDDDDEDDDNSSAPIVAFTRLWQDEPQADAPMSAAETPAKYNETFQKEMEILKQEVYHEGLQVEEEGLTDIIRRKTKLPSIKAELNAHTRNDNEQVGGLKLQYTSNFN